MNMATFRAALELTRALDCEGGITLGGGELTLHVHFRQMLADSIALSIECESELGVHVVTNGTHEMHTLWMDRLSKRVPNVFSYRISTDEYHNISMIPNRVRALIKQWVSMNRVYAMGRGRNISGAREVESSKIGHDCVCDDIVITPRGSVYQCGCRKRRLGDVSDRNIVDKCRAYLEKKREME